MGLAGLPLARARQYDLELSKKSRLRLDIDAAAVLFHDDVVAHRQAKPGTFARGLGCEKRVEYFLFDLFGEAGPVIANADFNLVSKVLRRSGKYWLEAVTGFRFPFRSSVEPVRYQIEQDSRNLLRIDVCQPDGRIEIALQNDAEACLFCSGAVIREVQAFIDYRVDVSKTMLAGTFTGVLQHVFHDRVGALAVLNNFFEIALQHSRQFVKFLPRCPVERRLRQHIVHLPDQFGRQRGKIVDEIEWVLDLVRDTGSELAERGELLGLHQAALGSAQFVERFCKFAGSLLDLLEKVDIRNRDNSLVRKRFHSFDLPGREWRQMRLSKRYPSNDATVLN